MSLSDTSSATVAFKRWVCAALSGGLFALSTPAMAQTYAAGLAAVDTGDMGQAVEIWQALIEADAEDRPQAEYALALLYETGRAVPWDEAKAAALYEASGLPEALTNLGLMYAEGRGVAFDPIRAAELWHQAANQGHSFASFNLGLAYYGGHGVPKNAVRALELIYDAGEGGLAEAQWAVCQFYERGVGVPADAVIAADWCGRAAEQGHEQAIAAVERLRLAQEQLAAVIVLDNADNVDLTLETGSAPSQPSRSGLPDLADPAQEFATELPELPPETEPLTDDPTEDGARIAALDPLLLLGSEFDEFADLLAPVEEQTLSDLSSSRPDDGQLSAAAGEIAALIESASVPAPDLPAINGAAEGRPAHEDGEAPAVRLSLQELVNASAPGVPEDGVPPLPANRPALTYAIPPVVEGPVYAVWLGSGESADEAEALLENAMQAAPDVLGLMEAAYQNDTLPADLTGARTATSVVRLLLGPLPGQDYAWQICNLLKLKKKSTFCLPVEVED